MMRKGQNLRPMTRVATWRQSCASFGLTSPSAPGLGASLLGYVNIIGTTKSAEHGFSDYSGRLS